MLPRLALALLATFALAAPAASAQGLPTPAPAGAASSPNVQVLRTFPQHSDTAGGRLLGQYFYITTERDLTIYDLGKDRVNAENPVMTDSVTFQDPGMPMFTEEDPDTNGKILLVWNNNALQVYDVENKSDIKLLSRIAGVTTFGLRREQHTITCVLDCTYAYGSEGAIVKLTDPKKPEIVGNWRTGQPGETTSTHDVTEVSPGILLTSTEPMRMLDARTNPAAPTEMGQTKMPAFTHANLWPRAMKDRFVLVGGEGANPGCSTLPQSTFQTYDTTGYETTGTFNLVDQFRVPRGSLVDGRAPDSTFCVHWFTEHPNFSDGGLVAISWYEQGTRFLRISPQGKISEVGYNLPGNGQASAAYWVTDRVVYVPDYVRGLDILKFSGDVSNGTTGATGATGPGGTTGDQASGTTGAGGTTGDQGTGSTGPAGPTGPPGSPPQPEPQPQPTSAPGTPGAAGLMGTSTGAGGRGGGGPQVRKGPSFDQLIILPSARRCGDRRSFRPRLRRYRDDPVSFIKVTLNGRVIAKAGRAKVIRGLRLKAVPRKRFSLRVDVRTKSGKRVAGLRTYAACTTTRKR